MKARQICGWSLMALGAVPGLVWASIMVYLFYVGPRIGWLSEVEEFLSIEGISLMWGAGLFAGIGVMAWGGSIRRASSSTEQQPDRPAKPQHT